MKSTGIYFVVSEKRKRSIKEKNIYLEWSDYVAGIISLGAIIKSK